MSIDWFPRKHLFDHALRSVLSPSITVVSEMSSCLRNSQCSMDFFVNSGVNWGFELLCNGKGIGEHINRFAAGEKYDGVAIDWRVIDFLRPGSQPQSYKNRVCVIFDPNYAGAMLHPSGQKIAFC